MTTFLAYQWFLSIIGVIACLGALYGLSCDMLGVKE